MQHDSPHPHAWRFGGSHAQRDLLSLTLIEAARRDGQIALARHYLAERDGLRRDNGLARRLHDRLQQASPPLRVAA